MSEPYLYEFLWRGRPKGAPQMPTYHSIIGQMMEVPGASEPQFVSSGPLTPERAEAAGYPLPEQLAEINTATLAALDAARAEVLALRQERDALAAQLAARTVPAAGEPAEPAPTSSAA